MSVLLLACACASFELVLRGLACVCACVHAHFSACVISPCASSSVLSAERLLVCIVTWSGQTDNCNNLRTKEGRCKINKGTATWGVGEATAFPAARETRVGAPKLWSRKILPYPVFVRFFGWWQGSGENTRKERESVLRPIDSLSCLPVRTVVWVKKK